MIKYSFRFLYSCHRYHKSVYFTYPTGKPKESSKQLCRKEPTTTLPVDKKPSYSQICRRKNKQTNKLDIGINGSIDNDFVIMAIDKISCIIRINSYMSTNSSISCPFFALLSYDRLSKKPLLFKSFTAVFQYKNLMIFTIKK